MGTEQTRVALLFPGQGSQQPRMAAGLHGHDDAFTDAIDGVFAAMGRAGAAVRHDWLADHPAVSVDHVTRSTPLLYAIGYGLAKMVQSWGVRPAALLGHSIGEMTAATLAGVFDPTEVARLIVERVRLLATAPPGGMLAVAADPARLRPYLAGGVAIGAVNAPNQTVLSGTELPLRRVGARLRADGVVCRPVPALSPFHSPAMAHLAAIEDPLFAAANLRAPAIPLFSGYTGARLSGEQARQVSFWTAHPAQPVLFWAALSALLATGDHLLVELGPGEALCTLARRHPAVARGGSRAVPALPVRSASATADRDAVTRLRRTLAQLDLGGGSANPPPNRTPIGSWTQ